VYNSGPNRLAARWDRSCFEEIRFSGLAGPILLWYAAPVGAIALHASKIRGIPQMAVVVGLWCVAALLAVAAIAIAVSRFKVGSSLVYAATVAISTGGLALGCWHLLQASAAATLVLPLGLPGIGAHFRLDALAAFFLIVVNLGGAAASLYAIGYGRHESEPRRVLPFFPAYLAGMNLVVLADDAFGFLVAWEFMSLASWAWWWPAIGPRRTRVPVTSIWSWRVSARWPCCWRSACWPVPRAATRFRQSGRTVRTRSPVPWCCCWC
jgi:hypothetical protein